MHNLFEGTAKTFIKLLLDNKIVNSLLVQNKSKAVVAPMKIGHLPLKIESNYSGFTADQWRNWVLLYSPIVLKDAIPHRIYSIWLNLFMLVDCCAGELSKSTWWKKRIIYFVPTVRVWKIILENSHAQLICICICIFTNVLWTMDVSMAIGVSHLKGIMEQLVTIQQT